MILNLMLGRERGGLEQAALDYAEALRAAGLPALSVLSPGAWVEAPMVAAGVAHESLVNRGRWDFIAPSRLRALAAKHNARIVLCHGNRALSLALRAFPAPRTVHLVAVSHNYSTRRFAKLDQCFAITQHLADHLKRGGAKNITLMPNMVRLHESIARPGLSHPPVIGSMGRFVAKKGFLLFIEALALLRERGVAFEAVLGGDGEDADAIDECIARYQLGGLVRRIGWVKDKTHFFEDIDVFVLPSLHEPFGIVLLEAMSHGVPVISTDSEGPSEILHHGIDGVLAAKGDAAKLADAIATTLADPARTAAMGTAGAALVAKEYSMDAMARRLQAAFAPYIA